MGSDRDWFQSSLDSFGLTSLWKLSIKWKYPKVPTYSIDLTPTFTNLHQLCIFTKNKY